MAIGRVFLTWKDWSTRQQGPLSLVSADRGLQCWLGCPDHLHSCHNFVVSLAELIKRAGRNEWHFIWLHIERPPLRSLFPGSQCKTDGSAVQGSCSKLLLGKHLWGMLSLPWGDSTCIWEWSACWWCLDRPDQMWNVKIGTQVHYYTLVLAQLQ